MSKIHTTIGVYPNGGHKVNGVKTEHLAEHIEYNKTFRFGRALIVDGEIVYLGAMSREKLEKYIKERGLEGIKMKRCTAPCH